MKHITLGAVWTVLLLAVGAARADTVVLKDGNFVEGKITLQTSRAIHVKTRFGTRIFQRKDIEEIIEIRDGAESARGMKFSELPAALRAVLNAEAEYKLGHYEAALTRLESYRDESVRVSTRRRMDWLIIESYERLGRWDEARKLLEAKKKDGMPPDRIRAETHLGILDANKDYDLRYVGETHARNFILDEDLRNRAKEPGALKDETIMRLALEQACEQLLVQDKLSVKSFAAKLDQQETYEACRKLPPRGYVGKHLPYMDDLKQAEATLAKARAILGDYGSAFEVDLAQAEMTHLNAVGERLLNELLQASPENFPVDFNARSGLLTPQGRVDWRRRCDEFLELAQPVARLLKYMIERVDYFPNAMRELRKLLGVLEERIDSAIKSVKKARSRTHV